MHVLPFQETMHINAWDCTWLPCNVLYMKGHAKQWNFMRTVAPPKKLHHTKLRSFLSKAIKVAEQNLTLLLLYQKYSQNYLVHWLLYRYPFMFFLMHSTFLSIFLQNNHFYPTSASCQSPSNGTFPSPFQRHGRGLYAAAKLECELRHCGHLLRCSDLTSVAHVSPSSNFEKPNPSCLNPENMETNAKGETVLIWCW